MMKLYSKETSAAAVEAMKRTGRFPHAFLLTGERGVGKKFFSDYIAMTLLCENGSACGECRHCRRILSGTHPDVIKPEKSGKKQIYNRETIRGICSDAYVAPNDCDAKVYIFTDCESIEESTQNLMLKLIEEPPDTAYFIFTAVNGSVFLPTILSRVVTVGIPEASEEACTAALADMGTYSGEQIRDAVRRFHGNIGCCIEYLAGGELAENTRLCSEIIAAIADGNEYELLKALHKAGDSRPRLRLILGLADKVIRDACMMRFEGISPIGCDPEGAERLSKFISRRRAETIHEAINLTSARCEGNANVPAEAAAFVCAVMR